MIARRTLPMLALAPALAPALARAQTRRLPVVAFVGFASVEGDRLTVEAFRDGMRAQGQVEGQHWRFEHRHADGDATRGAAIIRELAALPVDVFIVPGPAAARAVRRATAIPLVAIGLPPVESDPELFASLARPGGSVTGFASFGEEMSAKRIELLRETIPGLAAIGVLHNAADPTFDAWGRMTEASAAAQGLRAVRAPITSRSVAALAEAMRGLRAADVGAAVVVRDFLTSSMIAEIVAAATAERIAVIGDQARFAEAGALFSFGASLPDLFRRAAGYVVRILAGERPGDLPVQLPTAIEFVVNLRAARALGLVVPHAILARAEEVIE
jgi:putative ABC transport system substrate-binding protein